MVWLELFVIAAVVIAVLLYFANKDSKKIADKTEQMLIAIDNRYENFIYERVNKIQTPADFDVETLTEQARILLKPLIEGLISYVNSIIYSSVEIEYNSMYFSNLVGATEEAFRDSEKNKTKKLSPDQEKEFEAHVIAAVRADLTQRKMQLS